MITETTKPELTKTFMESFGPWRDATAEEKTWMTWNDNFKFTDKPQIAENLQNYAFLDDEFVAIIDKQTKQLVTYASSIHGLE